MSFGGPQEVGSVKATIGLDSSDLKRGLDQAKQALSEHARMTQDALRYVNDFAQAQERETQAAARAAAVKRQQAGIERELITAKAQLAAVLGQESAAAQAVAAKYGLLETAQRQQLVTVREQITAQKALQEAQLASAAAAEAAAARQLAAAQKNVGRNLGTVGRGLTAGVSVPIAAFEGAAALAGNDVQQAEAAIRAQTGAQGLRLASLDQSLRAVAATVPQSMKVVGDAIGQVAARTGFTGKALDDLTRSELNLARITGDSVTPLIKATTQTFTAWGITGAQMIPTLDLLNRAHQATGISVTKLATEAARLEPAFKNFGFGLTDQIALLAAFDKAGIPPQRMVQGLNQALARMAKEGVTNAHQALQVMIQRIERARNPMSAIAEATKLFGARVGPELVERLRSGQLSIEGLERTLGKNTDTIGKAAAQTRTFGVAFGEFRNQVEVALAPLGTILLKTAAQMLDGLKPLIDHVRDAIDWFAHLSTGAQNTMLAIVGGVALLGPAVVKIGGLITALTQMRTAMLELQLATSALSGAGAAGGGLAALPLLLNPITLALLTLTAVATAFATNWLGVADQFQRGADRMRQAADRALDPVATLIAKTAQQSASGSSRPGGMFTGGGGADAYLMAGMAAARTAPHPAGPIGPPLPPGYVRPPNDYVHALPGMKTYGPAELALQVASDRAYLGLTGQDGGTGDGNTGKRPKWLQDLMNAGKELTPLQREQKQYTEQLAQAHERLKAELAGEDNVTARLQAHFHLLHLTNKDDLVVTEQRIRAHEKATAATKAYRDALGALQQKIRDLKTGDDDKGLPAGFAKFTPAQQRQYRETSDYANWLKDRADASDALIQREREALKALHEGNAAWERELRAAAQLQRYDPRKPQRGYPDLAAALPQLPNLEQMSEQTFGGPLAGRTVTEQHELFVDQQRQAEKATREAGQADFVRDAQRRIEAGHAAYEREKTDFNALAAVKQKADEEERKRRAALDAAVVKDVQNWVAREGDAARKVRDQLNHAANQSRQFFEGMFLDLTEHGFKGFFQRTVTAFQQMLQQMAAAYLASRLTDLVFGRKDASSGERSGGLLEQLAGLAIGAFTSGGGSGGKVDSGAYRAGYALGGDYPAGQPFWAGERGPEMVFPRSSGTVLPHPQSMALAGAGGRGGDIHVHMTVNATDAASFRAPHNQQAIFHDLHRELERARRRG